MSANIGAKLATYRDLAVVYKVARDKIDMPLANKTNDKAFALAKEIVADGGGSDLANLMNSRVSVIELLAAWHLTAVAEYRDAAIAKLKELDSNATFKGTSMAATPFMVLMTAGVSD